MSDDARTVEDRVTILEERSASLAEELENVRERETVLLARLLAQGTVIEFLLADIGVQRGPIVEAAISAFLRLMSPPQETVLSDPAAVWWSDVAVRLPEVLDALLARSERVARKLREEPKGPPSA